MKDDAADNGADNSDNESQTASTRGCKSMAGVVEIRKAFERVKGQLETESCSNMDLPSEEPGAGKPHGIFSLQNFGNFAHCGSSSYHHHGRMSSLDSTNSDDGSFSFGSYGGHFGIGVKDNYGSITSLASSTSLISPQVNFTVIF